MRRILVFRGGALGDFVLTLPALTALRRAWPRASLHLVARPAYAELAKTVGLADEVRSLDAAGMAAYFSPAPISAESGPAPSLPEEEGVWVRGFDLVVNFLHDPDGVFRTNLEALGARRLVSASPQVASRHATEHFLMPLIENGLIRAPDLVPFLALPAPRIEEGKARLRRLGVETPAVAVHPGSGSSKKNWPAERFGALLGVLVALNICPILIKGEADDAPAEAVRRHAPRPLPEARNLSVVELAGLLAACRGYVGNDSGVTHLAAALGVPTVAIFGPTNPQLWAPRGRCVSVLRPTGTMAGSLEAVSVESVLEEILRLPDERMKNEKCRMRNACLPTRPPQ